MRGLGAVFDQRMTAYMACVEDADGKALSNELKKNVFGDADERGNHADALAGYIRQLRQTLSQMSVDKLTTRRIGASPIWEETS
jgi:hypothetical protein